MLCKGMSEPVIRVRQHGSMLTFAKIEGKSSPLNSIVGFSSKGSEYDAAIRFWLEYWKSAGVSFPDDLDPLMIKAMIAVESGCLGTNMRRFLRAGKRMLETQLEAIIHEEWEDKNMQIKFWDYILSHKKNSFFVLLSFLFAVCAVAGDPPIDRDFYRLPNGKWIWLEKTGWEKTRVALGIGKKRERNIVWSKEYESNDNRSWAYAYFVPLKKGKFAFDLDGKLEVGVATYDLGLLMIRDILIFTVEKDKLRLLREYGPYDMSADKSVF